MRTDVNGYDCTRGCTDTVRESALKVDLEKHPLPHQGIEPASAACGDGALSTELHPHPLAATTPTLLVVVFLLPRKGLELQRFRLF